MPDGPGMTPRFPQRPNIELLPGPFKYHVDFEHLHIGEETGMICVSRPTNPTGQVITTTS